MELLAMFAGGLLGSAHCIGMCGGFALAIGATRPAFWPTLANQLIYSAGRIFTYAFLGALAGTIGAQLAEWKGTMIGAQQVLSLVAGLTMLVVGCCVIFGVGLESIARRLNRPLLQPLTRISSAAFSRFVNTRNRWSFFLAGLFTGFLPCGLLYAFLALALAQGNAAAGALTMIAFGLGTTPAMVLIGCGGALTSRTLRARIHRVAACFVVLLGFATVARGLPFVPCHWLPAGPHATSAPCHCDAPSEP